MTTRWEALRCASLRCRREARYLVSAQLPRETEQPRLCLIHATGIVRNGTVPYGLMYADFSDLWVRLVFMRLSRPPPVKVL